MHFLIITAHPEASSYTHAVTRQTIAGIEAVSGNTVELVDLAADGFDPRYKESDYAAFLHGTAPDSDILAQQAKVDRAHVLIMIFPVYWWSMPALLKGWIDRVFTQGWAYIDDKAGTKRLLGKLAVQTIAIGGADRQTYERRGYFQAMQTQIDQGIFGYVGAPVIGSELILPLDNASATAGLSRAFEIGRDLHLAVVQK